MKLIKIISIIFIISIVFSISSAKADNYVGFNNITIPAIGGSYKSTQYRKYNQTKQIIETTSMTTSMKARTQAMLGQVEYSSYINLINGGSQTWGSENIDLNEYKLHIKCTSTNILNESYWGIWKYDWPV